jgi:hypothetical protein
MGNGTEQPRIGNGVNILYGCGVVKIVPNHAPIFHIFVLVIRLNRVAWPFVQLLANDPLRHDQGGKHNAVWPMRPCGWKTRGESKRLILYINFVDFLFRPPAVSPMLSCARSHPLLSRLDTLRLQRGRAKSLKERRCAGRNGWNVIDERAKS